MITLFYKGVFLNRIMVIDDEPDIASTVKMSLERDGFVVDSFTDPQTALGHFKQEHYSMVITDIRMPNMNGFELYRELKKEDENIKVAFMTAFEMYEEEFRRVFTNIDVKCFIKKPVSPSDLVRRVKEELGQEITFS